MFLYNLIIRLYGVIIRLASLKKSKAKLWVAGRRNWRENLATQISDLNQKSVIWFHCASLGEFEQGRPLIEAYKQNNSNHTVVLTFFSPSGFEIQKNYKYADIVAYLPLDTKQNAKDFLEIINPKLIVFVKYEFWVNFLNEIKRRNLNAYLISAVFKAHHPFFKWYGALFINSLKAFKTLYVQDKNSEKLLKNIGISNVSVLGDTRFDRVLEIKQKGKKVEEVEIFKGNSKLLIAGSTWPEDNDLIIDSFCEIIKADKTVKLLIAPHEINMEAINKLGIKLKNKNLKYCLYTKGIDADCDVLILDTIGMLSYCYAYANLAYIGGGFSDGIHNILEPTSYFIPTAFSNVKSYAKYNEAVDLIALKGAFTVNSAADFVEFCKVFTLDKDKMKGVEAILQDYFIQRGSVTEKLINAINFV